MDFIYLDNSATTHICESALEELGKAARCYGNPSSLHKAGNDARSLLEKAEKDVYKALGIRSVPLPSHKLIFTSCGTESNNLAILGVINAKSFRFLPRIITTDSEHPSVMKVLEQLESSKRAEVIYLSTVGGKIDKQELAEAVNERTVLISIMLVNNETGAVYNIKELFALAKAKNPSVITHSDMTQGFLKIRPLPSYASLGADLITVSGHKIHAPKGVAALAIKQELIKSKKIVPIIHGGGQADGLRSGTENVMGIAAFGGACRQELSVLEKEGEERLSFLRESFVSRLSDEIRVNTPEKFSPHIISITLPQIKSQTMLSHLSSKGIYVSSGSACASHGGHKSYVLRAFGLSPEEADCTLRISLSHYNTESELIKAADEINSACRNLIRIK